MDRGSHFSTSQFKYGFFCRLLKLSFTDDIKVILKMKIELLKASPMRKYDVAADSVKLSFTEDMKVIL